MSRGGPKLVPNKLQGRRKGTTPEMVDKQLDLWRKRRKKHGIVIGDHTEKQKEVNKRLREREAVARDVTKKGFFT